ncbi:L,D-transpeptidase family protein [Alphaproteobacteria bacterium GH1-50]|uniref:L,D-transpeptidase family protein n=1 Tax=Kangsaoukella pontilimi TaxID=2691042 RepID=A0A7C9IT89_9RHOB|nr:L,D-transpeptidase [Kangsaoukella pontilimi]MXQ08625.1 L,D-transpeptidase family protein [Kangsaoukella pontilimi]
MLTRRHFLATSTALFSAPVATSAFGQDAEVTLPADAVDPALTAADGDTAAELAEVIEEPVRQPVSNSRMWSTWDARVTPANYDPFTTNPWGFHSRFLPQRVEARSNLRVGDIHVDAKARYLYHIDGQGTAMRYGVAIARGNLYEPGTYTIRVKKKWPTWRPTEDMIEREPHKYEQFADGMDGGPSNPLGSRAFYLFEGRRDTYLRIHGTPQPRSIGGRASSGCVRMVMAHIIGLYDNVEIGARAYLYPVNGTLAG